jgi:DNA polymerase-4
MRVSCISAFHLAVQVERQRDPGLAQGPLVVGGKPWDTDAVLDCCPQAAATGVEPGMRLSKAERLCPAARFVPAQEEVYRSVHDALATAITDRFTPTVETASLGLLYAEISGLERRIGLDGHLAYEMNLETRRASGLDVWIGLGSSKFVAHQAARAARPGSGCAVRAGEERAFLSPLPLSVLPADAEMCRRLHLLGIRSLGALAALPRLAIVRQFGPHAGPIYDLARGVDPRPVRPQAPPLALERTRAFDDPLNDRGPLLAHAGAMANELSEMLSRHGYQAEGLRLRLEEESGETHVASTPVKPPSVTGDKLSRLAARLLGELSPAAPVTSLTLIVYPLRPSHLGATQLALFAPPPDQRREQLREALRGLRERFGELIIVVASLIGPPLPRPIQVTTSPRGVPRALVWRDRIRQVATVYEVWRERTRWWSLPRERDYYRLETKDGQVRVIFRDLRTDRWLLERRHV